MSSSLPAVPSTPLTVQSLDALTSLLRNGPLPKTADQDDSTLWHLQGLGLVAIQATGDGTAWTLTEDGIAAAQQGAA